MKHWLGLAALVCLCSTAVKAAVDVMDVNYSSYTTIVVSISNVTPTALFVGVVSGATTSYPNIMPGRTDLKLENIDPSSGTFINCVVDVSSSLPAGFVSANQVQYGPPPSTTLGEHILSFMAGVLPHRFKLAAQNSAGRYFIPWCLTNGKASAANIQVIQSF